MSHPLATDSPSIGKKISTINAPKLSTISQNPRPGLRHSISMPENEKLFTEAAALSAAPSGEILLKNALSLNLLSDAFFCKVENISKGSPDSIPSPSHLMKIQIMGGKFCLKHRGKTLLPINMLICIMLLYISSELN